jgi:hypothetical protein
MPMSNADRAMDPLEFRFTDAEDIGKYGEGWFVFDEGYWLRLRARDLIELETMLGVPIVHMMNGFRSSTSLGDTAAAWLGVRAVDPARAGDFDEFNPLTNTIEWRKVKPGKAPAPEATPEPQESTLPTESLLLPMTSGTPATVVLPSMPIAESAT